MNSVERIELFQREISYISNNQLKEFVKILLTNADDYFFSVPASSSGKYHPDFARGEGGLVRHTKAVAYFTNEFTRPAIELGDIDRYDADLLIVAAIAHDIKKQGNGTGGHTVNEHPRLAAEYIEDMWEEYGKELLDEDAMYFIRDVVERHMGPWSKPVPKTSAEKLVFYADYTASRKEILGLDFIEGGSNEAVEAYVPPTYTIDDYKFDFGKTKGLSIKESYEKEPGYVKWIANKVGFGNVEVQNLVKEFLKTI